MAAPVAPGTPIILSVSQGDLVAQFSVAATVDPTIYGLAWGTVNNPLLPGTETSLATTVGEFQRARALIGIGAQYYIWASATANAQTVFSAPLIFTEPADGRPGTPFLTAQETTGAQRLTWGFLANELPGTTLYQLVYGTTNNPLSPTNVYADTFVVTAPTVFGSGPTSLPFATPTVYVWASGVNNGSRTYSTIPFVYVVGATGIPPTGPTSGPIGVPPRQNTQLSVSFSTTGVGGTTPLTVNCLASTSPTGPFNITCLIDTVSPNNYLATTVDDLIPNTTYYFQTTVSNGFLPNQSTVSGPWATTNLPSLSIPVPTLVQATEITMRFSVPLSGFNVNDRTALLRWEARDTPAVLLANAVATTYLGVIDSQHTWEGTVYGLTPGRQYYFQGQYEPLGVSELTAVTTQQGNLFDLGYMPPRSWATPNPVIVGGVSQPWRQT